MTGEAGDTAGLGTAGVGGGPGTAGLGTAGVGGGRIQGCVDLAGGRA